MTARQVANVDALKAASAEFTAMRHLAMRFRGLLRGGTPERLDAWLIDARASGIYAMQRFARTIRQDLEAVRNAVLEPWSNGQTEGQINKLKTLKRAMYGRAGVDLLRARMLPLQEGSLHQEEIRPLLDVCRHTRIDALGGWVRGPDRSRRWPPHVAHQIAVDDLPPHRCHTWARGARQRPSFAEPTIECPYHPNRPAQNHSQHCLHNKPMTHSVS
jgi:hypothetical protein